MVHRKPKIEAIPAGGGIAPLFRASDIASIGGKCNLSPERASKLHFTLIAQQTTLAILDAYDAEERERHIPPPRAASAAYGAVADRCRDLLGLLGLPEEPNAVLNKSTTDIARTAGVLNHLFRIQGRKVASMLPADLVERFAVDTDPADVRLTKSAMRYVVDSARAIAFLAIVAEASRPDGRTSGPRADHFTKCLLDNLAVIYFDTFGRWPSIVKNVDRQREGPALDWLFFTLSTAHDRLGLVRLPGCQQMRAALKRMLDIDVDTRGSYFEKAIARMKRQHPDRLPQG